jgi:hypothetical protein
MGVAENNSGRAFVGRIRDIDGTLEHTGRPTQQEFTVLGRKYSGLLDCPGFCHDLLHGSDRAFMIPQVSGGGPPRWWMAKAKLLA